MPKGELTDPLRRYVVDDDVPFHLSFDMLSYLIIVSWRLKSPSCPWKFLGGSAIIEWKVLKVQGQPQEGTQAWSQKPLDVGLVLGLRKIRQGADRCILPYAR